MASHSANPPRGGRRALVPPAMTLGLWRLRQTWRLLSIAGLGIVAAAMLVAAVPFFTSVASSAGLRDALSAVGQNSSVSADFFLNQPQADSIQTISPVVDHVMRSHLGNYLLAAPPVIEMDTGQRQLYTLAGASRLGPTVQPSANSADLLGIDASDLTGHVALIRGRLPAPTTSGLEVVITLDTARALNVDVGGTLYLGFSVGQPSVQALSNVEALKVVGLITPNDPQDSLWLYHYGLGASNTGNGALYTLIAPRDELLSAVAANSGTLGVTTFNKSGVVVTPFSGPPPQISWQYQLDINHITADNMNDFTNKLQQLQNQSYNDFYQAGLQGGGGINIPALQVLSDYQNRLIAATIPTVILLIQIVALLIYFISMMAELIIERQGEAIAVLRSRGATRGQIFGGFAIQTFGLGIIAFIVGPLLAEVGVRLLVAHSLTAQDQRSLDVLPASPFHAIWDLRWYVGITALAAVGAMLIAVNRAANQDILSARREAARSGRKPLWQRLNLDLVFAVIALLGYTVYTYVTNSGLVNPQIAVVLSPLGLIAPIFVMLAAVLLFLRVFPLVLNLAARLAARGRGATRMLALAQMARAPRQAMRMTLLLALSTAFALFVVIFGATQSGRIQDVAKYQTVADFSGTLPTYTAASQPALDAQTTTYTSIPGVRAASLGYTAITNDGGGGGGVVRVGPAGPGGNFSQYAIMAVDAATFTQTAYWSDQYSTQALDGMMSGLFNARPSAALNDTVPVIVDDAAWSQLQLTPGAHFATQVPGYTSGQMNFVVVGRVHHIPSIYNLANSQGQGGFLVDYPSYAAVFAKDLVGQTLPPNHIWLRTASDAASLASVRQALGQGPTQLTALLDRYALLDTAQKNPLQLELLGVLEIGAVTAILLALVGNLVASWLSARSRQTNFAVLRALGTNTPQVAGILTTEQGIVYGTAILLGMIFGATLAALVLPLVVFTDLIGGSGSSNFFLAALVPAVRAVWPFETLGVTLGIIAGACVLALGIMTRVVTRPSVSQTLRLNED